MAEEPIPAAPETNPTPPAPETPLAEPAAPAAPEVPPAQPAQDEKPAETADAPKEEVPEDYGDFTDEKGVAFSSKDMPEFTAMAKELGLSKDRAQKLLMTMVPTVRTKLQTSIKAVNESWKQATLTDPEIGGANVKANLEVANVAYKKYASPELAKLLKSTGLSMHPDFIRMFYRIGKQIEQDQGVQGTGAPQPKARLFKNSPGLY
jgi:hypothetical protein